MTDCDHPIPTGLQTIEIRVPGANCTWCFNEAMARVRDLDGVRDVRASIVAECIQVQHDDVPIARLVDTLRTYLHGTDDSSHECQMVAVEPDVVTLACGCARSTATDDQADRSRPMETLVEASRRLRAAGYLHDFRATPEGHLICRSCGTSHDPGHIEIHETVRFEGESNPDDEAILLAISCADGCRGQFSAAFGPATPIADVRALRRFTPSTPGTTDRDQLPGQ